MATREGEPLDLEYAEDFYLRGMYSIAPALASQPQPQGEGAAPPRAPARPRPSRQLADE